MAKDQRGNFFGDYSLKNQLTDKSHRRRKNIGRLAEPAAAARPLRNDVLPSLELVRIGLDDLRMPKRKVRKSDPAHVREVAGSISALGFCVPVLLGRDNMVIHGVVSVDAARLLGLGAVPCIRVGHLTDAEQRTLRLAVNRLSEKGQWDLGELKLEFEELILADAPIEIAGFSKDEMEHILLDDDLGGIEIGPLEPGPGAVAVVRQGDIFQLGGHRIVCGDSTDPAVMACLMNGAPPARLILTDEPYNVSISGHVSGGAHREFAMASGEMSDSQFHSFNVAWIGAVLPHLRDGGVFGTFIDWRGHPIVLAAASKLGLNAKSLAITTP